METCSDCGEQYAITEGHVCGPTSTKAVLSNALLIAALEHAGIATERGRVSAMLRTEQDELMAWAARIRELALGRIEWEASPSTKELSKHEFKAKE